MMFSGPRSPSLSLSQTLTMPELRHRWTTLLKPRCKIAVCQPRTRIFPRNLEVKYYVIQRIWPVNESCRDYATWRFGANPPSPYHPGLSCPSRQYSVRGRGLPQYVSRTARVITGQHGQARFGNIGCFLAPGTEYYVHT